MGIIITVTRKGIQKQMTFTGAELRTILEEYYKIKDQDTAQKFEEGTLSEVKPPKNNWNLFNMKEKVNVRQQKIEKESFDKVLSLFL